MLFLFYIFGFVKGKRTCDPGWKSYVVDGTDSCFFALPEYVPFDKTEVLCEMRNATLPILTSDQTNQGKGLNII